MAVPVTVVKSYDLPAFCGPDTLVLAVSFSGDTAETLEAAGAAAAARGERGGRHVGRRPRAPGRGRAAGRWRPCPADIPQPRAGPRGHGRAPRWLRSSGWGCSTGMTDRLAAAAEYLARRRDQLAAQSGPPVSVARRIGRTFPLVHGSPGPSGVGRAAVEDPGAGERQVPGVRLAPARAVPQRGGRLGAGRGRDPSGAHPGDAAPRRRAPRDRPPVRPGGRDHGGGGGRRGGGPHRGHRAASPASSTWPSSATSSRCTWPGARASTPARCRCWARSKRRLAGGSGAAA